MALAAASVFEVRTTGSDLNGGGFVTGAAGTDYSQQDAKNTVGADISTTDAVGNGTTTITSALANFGATIVGNIIRLAGGTGALASGWYQVATRTDANTITVDRVVAAGTGITMDIGGALATLGQAGAITTVAQMSIWVKSGAYTMSSATPNVANGTFSGNGIFVEGYQTVRGDLGTPPVFTASGITNFTMYNQVNGANPQSVVNLTMNGISAVSSRGFFLCGYAYKCKGMNFVLSAFDASGAPGIAFLCEATGCSINPGIRNINCFGCYSHDNTAFGFATTTPGTHWQDCIAKSNTGATTDGFNVQAARSTIVNCTSYGNGRDGFQIATNPEVVINCLAENNAGWGFNTSGSLIGVTYANCGGFNNTLGNITLGATSKTCRNLNFVTATSTFFTNGAAGDFSLNSSGTGGALARATGLPALFPGGLTTGYPDLGAVQHQVTGSSGGGGQQQGARLGTPWSP